MEQDYQAFCEQYDLDPDPSVLVSLSTAWPFVYATNDVSLLPLLYAVERHKDARTSIKELRLVTPDESKTKHCNPMAESNARVVRQLMEICTGLEVVDLTNVGLGSKGVIEVGYGIAKSKSVRKVSLRRNPRVSGSSSVTLPCSLAIEHRVIVCSPTKSALIDCCLKGE